MTGHDLLPYIVAAVIMTFFSVIVALTFDQWVLAQ